MPFISFKMTAPSETFVLTKDLKFSKIKVVDVTVDTNGFNASLTNVLFSLNDLNENMFVFTEGNRNSLNSDYLLDLPIISGSSFHYHPVELKPYHYSGAEQSIRYLRFKCTNDEGQVLSATDFGTTEIHFILWFE